MPQKAIGSSPAANRPAPPSPADDLLFGAKAIAKFIGAPLRRTFYLLEQGHIPSGKMGRHHIASKSKIRERLDELTRSGDRA
jgi:hypothetical protein